MSHCVNTRRNGGGGGGHKEGRKIVGNCRGEDVDVRGK